ncbi:MAG: PDZ domain-containing protein [Promicromonosporaceae bacterium]|nr:PDZ domain-containing protein [Promicromonosporaceae bacterium]
MSTSARPRILVGSMLATSILATVALFLPTGFVVRSPGPTHDTLGMQNGVPLVQIMDATQYPASGQLLMTTVSVGGGPVSNVFALQLLRSWFSPARSAVPVETVWRTDITREEQQQQGQVQMITSQQAATAAALLELGFEIPVTLIVAGATQDSGAEGIVEEGDIIMTLDGAPVDTHGELVEALTRITPGDVALLGVDRDGERLELEITTGAAEMPDGRTRAALGIWVSTIFADFPVDVQIRIEDIGGPSAGVMFALAIIDLLTPADELGGAIVAGTGTISADGEVGPVGGVEQKIHGAWRDGAKWFLVPIVNCEAATDAPSGIRVVSVSTLSEALSAIRAIGEGRGDELPGC